MNRETYLSRLWVTAVWALVIFFVINVLAMIATVVVNSLRHALVRHVAAPSLTR